MKRTGSKTPERVKTDFVPRTPDQVKTDFALRGESIAEWCRKNRVSLAAAYRVLREPQLRAKRGECHRAAVLLGLKHGIVAEEQQ